MRQARGLAFPRGFASRPQPRPEQARMLVSLPCNRSEQKEEREPERGVRCSATPWRRLLTEPQLLFLTLSYACYGYAGYVYFAWFFDS